ncbi:MAG: double-strand break repair protein AddB [Acidocella sp.]|nr:double-strand break repair protein AddB [Acidocella sp.]
MMMSPGKAPHIAAFAAQDAYLPALAQAWLAEATPEIGQSAEGLLILPSRRAAQALAGAFLAASGGQALLLPRIIALGAIDEPGLNIADGLALPPAIPVLRRQAILARLILALKGAHGAPARLPAAWALAADLANLLDEADYAEIDLGTALPGLVGAELAEHWQVTLEFLKILTVQWPEILAAEGMMNPARRQIALIDAQGQAWANAPPDHRVWLVASSANPALTRLARVIASLPRGWLLLPGYDAGMDDAAWAALEDGHPQAGIARLLAALGAGRADVMNIAQGSNAPRRDLLSRALLPAASLSAWQTPLVLDITGISRIVARDEADGALSIAMVLRDTLEIPGRTAAFITPDRDLAQRVAAALKRFGITADDSAGEKLEQTPPATLLRLLARAIASDFAPLPLLALLKHPLTAAGLPPAMCREQARALERHALRGARPAPGFDGIKYRLAAQTDAAAMTFLDRLEAMLRPAIMPLEMSPATALAALLGVAEALCATPDQPGAAILWAGEAGGGLSDLLREALAALADMDDIAAADMPDLLDALLSFAVVRRPRARDGHPRIAIWGIQEAALQSVDVAVLGGLVEGVWPAAADPGPWLSRPMRAAAGLPSPECAIGEAAHAFFALACACPEVILATTARRDRAPAVPARWITRLEAMLKGAALALPAHDAVSWAAQLDQPAQIERRPRPHPRPPASARPTSLSISDIATLMADPYAVYARKILGIRALDGLDEESDQSLFGSIIHTGLERFFSTPTNAASPDAGALDETHRLTTALHVAMREARPRAALEGWWEARLARIAAWVIEAETARRIAHGLPRAMALECAGKFSLPGGFTMTGRADRIERRADDGLCIIDYKSGTVPAVKDVLAGTAPQLPLEAVMAAAGCFGAGFTGPVAELTYWRLSGRHQAGEEKSIDPKPPDTLAEIIARAATALPSLFAHFAKSDTAFLASPHPGRVNKFDDYAGLSRKAEWSGEAADDGD